MSTDSNPNISDEDVDSHLRAFGRTADGVAPSARAGGDDGDDVEGHFRAF